MRVSERLAQVGIVLKDTTHPGNIGSTARAMKTMGLSQLILAAPQTRIDSAARALAVGASELLDAAEQVETLPDALTAFTHVYALSARRRDLSPPRLTPRQAAEAALAQVNSGGRVAFVFGGERSGLTSADVRLAGSVVEIPANPAYSSLNLAQAVQIICYELRLAAAAAGGAADARDLPTQEAFNAMLTHMQTALAAVGLPKANDTRPLMPRLRRLLLRADLENSEVRLLRGIWRAIIKSHEPDSAMTEKNREKNSG